MNVNFDFLGKNGAQGDVASYMSSQGRMDSGMLRPFIGTDGKAYVTIYKAGPPDKATSYQTIQVNAGATLRREEWQQLDQVLIDVARYRLGGVQDLIDHGLTFNLGNAMGTTVLEYHDVSDAMEADLTMDGVTRSKGDRPAFGTHYLPIPIIHVDYEINTRVLEASRRLGNPLDTTSVERAVRKCMEKIETMMFTDTKYTFGGGTIYSLLNHPDNNLVTLDANWDASGKTGAQIVADVVEMKQSSINAYHYGPWMLYIPTAYETVLDKDYDSTTPGTTIRERIMKISGIKGIKVVDTLTANNLLLVQMTPDVVRLVRGIGLTNVEWTTEGKFINKYKVLTIQVPQVRSDYNGKSGIVHMS